MATTAAAAIRMRKIKLLVAEAILVTSRGILRGGHIGASVAQAPSNPAEAIRPKRSGRSWLARKKPQQPGFPACRLAPRPVSIPGYCRAETSGAQRVQSATQLVYLGSQVCQFGFQLIERAPAGPGWR